MTNSKTITIQGMDEILGQLNELLKRNILLKALSVGAYNLRESTRNEFKATDINYNSEQAENGVQMKIEDKYNRVRVYLKPQLFMHWFESGTQDRYLRKTGRYTGRITPKNYFLAARSNEQAIYDSIFQSIENQIKNITK